jgi:hypothetical protein
MLAPAACAESSPSSPMALCLGENDDVVHMIVARLSLVEISSMQRTCKTLRVMQLPGEHASLKKLVVSLGERMWRMPNDPPPVTYDIVKVHAMHLRLSSLSMVWIDGAIVHHDRSGLVRVGAGRTNDVEAI